MDSGNSRPLLKETVSPFADLESVMDLRFHAVTYAADAISTHPAGLVAFLHSHPQIDIPVSIKNAAPERLVDFVAGRFCATQALNRAGAWTTQIGVAESRAPLWPAGWCGAITHVRLGNDGYAAAVVGATDRFRGVGIDSEQWLSETTSKEILEDTSSRAEVNRLGKASNLTTAEAHTLAFSAKESLFKCLYPASEKFFDFPDAELISSSRTSEVSGIYRIRLHISLANPDHPASALLVRGFELEGRFFIESRRIHTLCWY